MSHESSLKNLETLFIEGSREPASLCFLPITSATREEVRGWVELPSLSTLEKLPIGEVER